MGLSSRSQIIQLSYSAVYFFHSWPNMVSSGGLLFVWVFCLFVCLFFVYSSLHWGLEFGRPQRRVFASRGIRDKKKTLFWENNPSTRVKTIHPGFLCQENGEEGDRYSSYPMDLLFPDIQTETLCFHQGLSKGVPKNLDCLSRGFQHSFPASVLRWWWWWWWWWWW